MSGAASTLVAAAAKTAASPAAAWMPIGLTQAMKPLPNLWRRSVPLKRAQRGLYAGAGIGFGNKVSEQGNKSRRSWKPNVALTHLYSETLGIPLRIRTSARALRWMDKAGGLDAYLLNTRPDKLQSVLGLRLRDLLTRVQAAKAKLAAEAPNGALPEDWHDRIVRDMRKPRNTLDRLSLQTLRLGGKNAGLQAAYRETGESPIPGGARWTSKFDRRMAREAARRQKETESVEIRPVAKPGSALTLYRRVAAASERLTSLKELAAPPLPSRRTRK